MSANYCNRFEKTDLLAQKQTVILTATVVKVQYFLNSSQLKEQDV